jgi:DNA polymerase
MTRLHLDYETASELNLKKTGAYKYAADHSTRILMLGWAFDDEPVSLWEPHKGPIPDRLMEGLRNPEVNKYAYNAAFERLITRHCLGVEVPPEEWRCTMVESYYLGFAGKMDNVLKAIGLTPKDDRGNRLINVFCTPAPKNHKADWYDHNNKPEEWQEFCEYCVQDVHVERQLWHWMQQFPEMLEWDRRQWVIDQEINDRGVPMDVDLALSAIEIWDKEKAILTDQLGEVTGLTKVTRVPFLEWMTNTFGVELLNLTKDYLAAKLKKGDLPPEAQEAVGLWAQKEGKAVSKYTAVVNGTGEGSRARGMFQYKGASRTDRVGGRLIQLQNLKRPIQGDTPAQISNVVGAIKTTNPLTLRLVYPQFSVSDILGGSIRHVISAEHGKSLAVCDLTSIESVILGWVAMCPEIDRTFRQGRDSYRMFASKYYDIPYEEVTKAQRSFSKPPVLGCGFMLGWKGLIAYAEGYGVDMSQDQAKMAVDTFRGMYPEIPAFWKWIDQAAKYVTQTGMPLEGYRLKIERDDVMLRIWLPSGRALSYYLPEVQRREAPWSTPESVWMIDNFTYMGMNDKSQWVRISAHAGGLTENIVQSLAGDILWSGIRNATDRGLPVVLHVHDEIAGEVPDEYAEQWLEVLQECMTRQPHWCRDMWLGADGFITKRYTKD